MPQHDLFGETPQLVRLIITMDDHTLQFLEDATTVTFEAVDVRDGRHWLARAMLPGVAQDLLWTLLERASVAFRYGTPADLRLAVSQVMKEAREHVKAHERE